VLNRLRTYGERLPFARRPSPAATTEAPPYPQLDYPVLRKEHLTSARLHADRTDMIASLPPDRYRVVAEIGVAMGDFSEVLLEKLAPTTFVAVDLFQLHGLTEIWGRSAESIFGELTHLEFYRQRFAGHGDTVVVEEGLSWEVMARYPDAHFDLIYIDAAHDYDGVKLDVEQAVKKVKPDGLLVFNDYIMYDHMSNVPYGVVPNVNELIVNGGWQVAGFALQHGLFCDIALSRR
jgi:Methyltransferase domain